MDCFLCNSANRPERRFCRSCGGPLFRPCGTCGFGNELDASFCGGCGSHVIEDVASPRDVVPPSPRVAPSPQHAAPAPREAEPPPDPVAQDNVSFHLLEKMKTAQLQAQRHAAEPAADQRVTQDEIERLFVNG